jgi:type IV pilus assembly protein PilB
MAQRLVRRICEECRESYQPTAEELELSGLPDERRPFFLGRGCYQCHGTGFRGRTAVCELLSLSDRLRQLILDRRSASELKQAAREEGMVSVREHALESVFAGITTLADINKVTFVE